MTRKILQFNKMGQFCENPFSFKHMKRRSLDYFGERVIRTSDGGNGNHSVSLPIILIKMKVDQMLPSSYISSL